MFYNSRFNRHLIFIVTVSLAAGCGGGGGGDADADADGDGFSDRIDVDDDNDGLIEIASLEQLDWTRNDGTGSSLTNFAGKVDSSGCPVGGCNGYELIVDLDFDTNGDGLMDGRDAYFDYDGDGSDSGWLPIGSPSEPFGANFDGNGYSIRNLYIDRPDTDIETGGRFIGLFGLLNRRSGPYEIRNLVLDGALTGVTGSSATGGLVGRASSDATVSNVNVNGSVSASDQVGGLIGDAFEGIVVRDSEASGSVTGASEIGGLVGSAQDDVTINDCSVGNLVTGNSRTGGLVGYARDNINLVGSDASGDVSGSSKTGGLVGYANDDVTMGNSTSSGDVTGSNETGGLVGHAENGVTIDGSSASGGVSGASDTGGLVGRAVDGVDISNSYATGNVIASGSSVGGLVGRANVNAATPKSTIQKSFATGSVTATDAGAGLYVGGLVGLSYTLDLDDAFATGAVSGVRYVGGLVGDANAGTGITKSFAVNAVNGNQDVGGFVGWSDTATYEKNYYSNSTAPAAAFGTVHAGDGSQVANVTGRTTAALQAPTVAAGDPCTPQQLYCLWDNTSTLADRVLWDYGSSSQLPGLILGGIVYRDGDADGVLD